MLYQVDAYRIGPETADEICRRIDQQDGVGQDDEHASYNGDELYIPGVGTGKNGAYVLFGARKYCFANLDCFEAFFVPVVS